MSDILQERRLLGAVAERRTAEPDPDLLSPATQVVGDTEAYLGGAPSDIGRRIGDDQLEMFVVCAPAEALLLHFRQQTPDFIALHDVGTTTSARLLAAVAQAASRKLQKLVIRRQGYGVALATLQFVELPLSPGRNLRVYTTQIDADTQTRHQLAQVLLAHSRLAVLMIGELPAHALDSSLQPLREAIAAGPWPNRQMLLVPLAPAASLPAQAAALAGHSSVTVRTTPQAARPAEAWTFISGAWNRLNTPAAEAPRRPLAPGAMPPAAALSPAPAQGPSGTSQWHDYVRRCAAIKGVLECCVFDIDQQRSLAYAGTPRMAERLAAKGAMLHAVIGDCAGVLGLDAADTDAAITLPRHHLLLRNVPGHPRLALHLLIDRSHGNIGLARAQLLQIDQSLPGG